MFRREFSTGLILDMNSFPPGGFWLLALAFSLAYVTYCYCISLFCAKIIRAGLVILAICAGSAFFAVIFGAIIFGNAVFGPNSDRPIQQKSATNWMYIHLALKIVAPPFCFLYGICTLLQTQASYMYCSIEFGDIGLAPSDQALTGYVNPSQVCDKSPDEVLYSNGPYGILDEILILLVQFIILFVILCFIDDFCHRYWVINY